MFNFYLLAVYLVIYLLITYILFYENYEWGNYIIDILNNDLQLNMYEYVNLSAELLFIKVAFSIRKLVIYWWQRLNVFREQLYA